MYLGMFNLSLSKVRGECSRVRVKGQGSRVRLALNRYNRWDGVMMRRDEAIAVLRGHSGEVAAFGVKSLALFGSVARGEAGPESDLDLLVEFEGAATFDRYMGLKLYLEDLLGSPVDLVMRKALRRRMVPSVERDAVRVA
jgi:predicted nucleotidyltransferase